MVIVNFGDLKTAFNFFCSFNNNSNDKDIHAESFKHGIQAIMNKRFSSHDILSLWNYITSNNSVKLNESEFIKKF